MLKLSIKSYFFLLAIFILLTGEVIFISWYAERTKSHLEKSRVFDSINHAIYDCQIILNQLIIENDKSIKDECGKKYYELKSLIIKSQSLSLNEEEKAALDLLLINSFSSWTLLDTLTQLLNNEKIFSLKQISNNDHVNNTYNKLIHLSNEMIEKTSLLISNISELISKEQTNSEYISYATLSTFVLIIFSAGILFRRWVIIPLRVIRQGINIISSGNLLHNININSNDEFGELAKLFNKMTSSLKASYEKLVNEIEQRKIAEKILKENEEILMRSERNLAEAQQIAHIGSHEHDILTNKLYWSDEVYRIFGISKEEFNNTPEDLLKRIHPEDLNFVTTTINENLALKKGAVFEHRILRPNGEVRYVEQRFEPYYDQQSNHIRNVGVIQDITERKLAEKALLEAEAKFRTLVEQSLVGVYIIQENKFPYVNPRAAEIFGYTQEEIISNLSVDDVVFEEDLPLVKENLRKRFEGETHSIQYTIRGVRKDKELIDVELYGSRTEYNGKPAIIGTLLNITDRKLAEKELIKLNEYLNAIIEASPFAILDLDIEGNVKTIWNKSAEKIFGWKKEEVIGKVIPVVPLERKDEFIKLKQEVLSGKSFTGVELIRKRKDGNNIVINLATAPLHDIDGQISGVMGIVEDITSRKKAEEELKKYQEELRQLTSYLQKIREEERASIAREIHDELAQVLTTIKMNLSYMNKEIERSKKDLDYDYINNEIKSMLTIIDSTVRNIRNLITRLRPEILDHLGLVAALEEYVEDFESKIGINVKFSSSIDDTMISPNVSITIFRIVQEALTNVARHSNARNVFIKLSLKENMVNLIIKDDGIGFSKDKLSKPKSFGLIGIRERVNIFNGKFDIKTEPNRGTQIEVIIPMTDE